MRNVEGRGSVDLRSLFFFHRVVPTGQRVANDTDFIDYAVTFSFGFYRISRWCWLPTEVSTLLLISVHTG